MKKLFFFAIAALGMTVACQKEVKVENHSYEKEIRDLAKQIEKIDKELGLDKKAS